MLGGGLPGVKDKFWTKLDSMTARAIISNDFSHTCAQINLCFHQLVEMQACSMSMITNKTNTCNSSIVTVMVPGAQEKISVARLVRVRCDFTMLDKGDLTGQESTLVAEGVNKWRLEQMLPLRITEQKAVTLH